MATRIRCRDCRKKISIDNAFAGGVCRCPYCAALVLVPNKGVKAANGARPESPTGRPDAPASPPASPTDPADETAIAAAHGQTEIPTAKPVKLQGIISIILSVLIVGMIIAFSILVGQHVAKDIPTSKKPPESPPITADYGVTAFTINSDHPAVAGDMKVATPVVYCIDVSDNMHQVIEYAGEIAKASLKSLDGAKFTVILLGEEADQAMSDQLIEADQAAQAKVRGFLTAEVFGAADLARGLRAALAAKPATIVLMARSTGMDTQELQTVAEEISTQGTCLLTIALDASADAQKELADLARSTGGESRTFTAAELDDMWTSHAAGESHSDK